MIHPADARELAQIEEQFLLDSEFRKAQENTYLTGYIRGRLDGADSSHRTMAAVCERMRKKETT